MFLPQLKYKPNAWFNFLFTVGEGDYTLLKVAFISFREKLLSSKLGNL